MLASAEHALPVIGDAKQATSEGKSGPVETGLTEPAATAQVHLDSLIGKYVDHFFFFELN